MAHALAHSSESHPRALGLNLSESFRGHPLSLVFNPYMDLGFFALNPNHGALAFRVTMNVCQGFLDKPEYQKFHVGWESSEIISNLQINL